MPATVADQVVERVEALLRDGQARTQAEAIRRVAAEMDRSVPATSSAYYAGRRAAAPTTAAPATAEAVGGRETPLRLRLFAEMLPLVEAGATIEQAARRFGDEDAADEIAAGFARWLLRERTTTGNDAELAEARRRITALEGEVRDLRRELARATRAVARIRSITGDALGESR